MAAREQNLSKQITLSNGITCTVHETTGIDEMDREMLVLRRRHADQEKEAKETVAHTQSYSNACLLTVAIHEWGDALTRPTVQDILGQRTRDIDKMLATLVELNSPPTETQEAKEEEQKK